MSQLENIEAIERRLWSSADNLRANSNYASNEYFLPVMGLIFLRHAFSRFLTVKEEIVAGLPTRGGKTRALTKEDFSRKSALYLREEAQFDHLVGLPGGQDRAQAVIHAMETIEADYPALLGVLPKGEYQELDNEVLGTLINTFDDVALKKASGDIFGRIYEYFLTQFADQKAHDGGEFFTPVSLVQTIVNVIEPDHGRVLDPACGSGGMFVQSAHFIEGLNGNPAEAATFYGMEKNPTTIRLAQMNLAVHGLEGQIHKAITYYEDPHELMGKADFVMANPPFNVDEVDAEKVKNDPRLPFGLPGVNKKGAVSNGNYLWISYFYSYLNATGRAGFVMSSQASSAGRQEAEVRRKMVESGHVDVMVAIRSNFFYTRTVPCELWFFDKGKSEAMRDRVLMIDARNVYRKVTRKIYDFSPEQTKNLAAIVWLYRGQSDRFLALVTDWLDRTARELLTTEAPLNGLLAALSALINRILPFLKDNEDAEPLKEPLAELIGVEKTLRADAKAFKQDIQKAADAWMKSPRDNAGLHRAAEAFAPLVETCRDLVKQADLLYKLAARVVEICDKELSSKSHDAWITREVNKAIKALDAARHGAVEQLKLARYFFKQARWLQERFPDAELRDVPGLVKLVDRAEIKANDWSLTPGRYVGVAPEAVDEEFDFEETLREIHMELLDLNLEASDLADRIARNFEELGV
ncbi:MAG: N-6 DNA methylase [Magnetococcales bacterium]|nr:N-6 DNA methylase [Magnetococcales bacterium]